MAGFSISQPKTFKAEVAIPQLGGDPISVPFEFNAFTREEIGKIQDEWQKEYEGVDDSDASNVEVAKKLNDFHSKQIKKLIASWGFDDQLNDKNIIKLVNTITGSGEAIIRTYFEELAKARLGN